jgi:hypothetical protein
MKYPQHEHARRAILSQEPRRDRDLTDEDLEELQSRRTIADDFRDWLKKPSEPFITMRDAARLQ